MTQLVLKLVQGLRISPQVSGRPILTLAILTEDVAYVSRLTF